MSVRLLLALLALSFVSASIPPAGAALPGPWDTRVAVLGSATSYSYDGNAGVVVTHPVSDPRVASSPTGTTYVRAELPYTIWSYNSNACTTGGPYKSCSTQAYARLTIPSYGIDGFDKHDLVVCSTGSGCAPCCGTQTWWRKEGTLRVDLTVSHLPTEVVTIPYNVCAGGYIYVDVDGDGAWSDGPAKDIHDTCTPGVIRISPGGLI